MLPFKIDKEINYPSLENRKQMSWCIDNNIVVYCIPIDNFTCKIRINNKGDEFTGAQIYRTLKPRKGDAKWGGIIWAIYKGFYNYYNNN